VACGQTRVDRQRRARAGAREEERLRRFNKPAPAAVHDRVRRGTREGSAGATSASAAITAAMNSGTGLNILQKEMPERLLRRGHRGAARDPVRRRDGRSQGMKPVAAIYSTFLQRAFDPIVPTSASRTSTSCSRWDRAGAVGDDGPTHHGAFDIAYMRALPNIVMMAPARRGDAREHAAHRHQVRRRADSLRYPRGEAEGVAIRRAPSRSTSAPARSCARASAWHCSATAWACR